MTNYTLPYRKEDVEEWTLKFLENEEYGSLNKIRDKTVSWLHGYIVNNETMEH